MTEQEAKAKIKEFLLDSTDKPVTKAQLEIAFERFRNQLQLEQVEKQTLRLRYARLILAAFMAVTIYSIILYKILEFNLK